MSIAANLKSRRLRLELSQKELAARAGVSQQLIHALEAGTIRSTKHLGSIALALSCAVSELEENNTKDYPFLAAPIPQEMHVGELPIYLASESDSGMAPISEVAVDYVSRPMPLRHVRSGYGILIASALMFPEFAPGDYAMANPHLPPMPDTTCIFFSKTNEGEFAITRRLISFTADEWFVRAWNNDPAGARLSRKEWTKCHRIVARHMAR